MSTKTIPAQTIKTCDACNTVMDGRNSRESGALVIKRDALDLQGSTCADASMKLDLCDRCLHAVAKAVDEVLHATRRATGATP